MYYIKVPLNICSKTKPKSDHIVLEFKTESEAIEFQNMVIDTTGIPFSVDFGNSKDGFESYSCTKRSFLKRIKVRL